MPEKRPSPRRRRAIRLSRSSCLTERDVYPLSRSSRIVVGLAMSAPLGFVGSLCGGRCPLSIRRGLTRGNPPVRMRTMPRGPGADRSGWLLPIALFALLLPTVLGIVVDDGGIWVYDPFDDDDDRLRVAASARSGPAWTVPAP